MLRKTIFAPQAGLFLPLKHILNLVKKESNGYIRPLMRGTFHILLIGLKIFFHERGNVTC